MKNIFQNKLIKIFFINLFVFLSIFITGCITASVVITNKIISSSFADNVVNLIEKEPTVKNVKTWCFDGDIISKYFDMEIEFNNGGNIWVFNVNQWGKEDKNKPMDISIINDYKISFYNNNKNDILPYNDLNIWSNIIGMELKNIIDVVKNHHIISEHVENWINLSDYKKENDIFIQTINNIIENNYYCNTIIVNGDEIVLFKRDLKTKWKHPTKEEILETSRLLQE